MNNWQELQDEIGEWSDNQFGFNRSPIGSLNHLVEEVQELLEEPHNMEEYADCLMIILDAARMAGINTYALFESTKDKLEVNKKRKWSPLDENGVSRHIK